MKTHYKWIILFGVALGITTISIMGHGVDKYLYLALVVQPVMAPFYVALAFFGVILRNMLFTKRKYFYYVFALLVVITLSSILANYLSPYGGTDFEPISLQLHFISITFILILTSFVQSIKVSIERKVVIQEYEYERMQAALQLLKRQLNPHFLFNTLNSIYVRATQQSQETADMILNLSDMLRYQLKMETTAEVTLQEEIVFLQNYIFFEKRRLPPNIKVDFVCEINSLKLKIAPNMFTPLVENTFKHGLIAPHESTISIKISQKGRLLILQTSNSISDFYLKDSGTGIANLRKRLEFLYPNKHELTLEKLDNTFHGTLRIRL